ncbi:MAG: hypothetical protein M1830_000399 [Pleopsidium flavum]|nr:MAG: hypothetical protein M1830_000399 [Pleopsidium flavum]
MILELDPDSIGYDPSVPILDPIKDLLRWSCRGLVEIKDDRVQFIHFTVKEYLVSEKPSPFYVDKVKANGDITTICLTYLTFATTPDFTKGVTAEAGLDMVIDNLWIPILGVPRTTDPTIIARKDPPYLQNSTIDRTVGPFMGDMRVALHSVTGLKKDGLRCHETTIEFLNPWLVAAERLFKDFDYTFRRSPGWIRDLSPDFFSGESPFRQILLEDCGIEVFHTGPVEAAIKPQGFPPNSLVDTDGSRIFTVENRHVMCRGLNNGLILDSYLLDPIIEDSPAFSVYAKISNDHRYLALQVELSSLKVCIPALT